MTGCEAFLATALSQRDQRARPEGGTKYGEWFAGQVHDGSHATGDFCAIGGAERCCTDST